MGVFDFLDIKGLVTIFKEFGEDMTEIVTTGCDKTANEIRHEAEERSNSARIRLDRKYRDVQNKYQELESILIEINKVLKISRLNQQDYHSMESPNNSNNGWSDIIISSIPLVSIIMQSDRKSSAENYAEEVNDYLVDVEKEIQKLNTIDVKLTAIKASINEYLFIIERSKQLMIEKYILPIINQPIINSCYTINDAWINALKILKEQIGE